MENKKEKTTPNVSVGADMEQPIQKIAENSISEYEENIKSFEEMRRRKFTVGIIVAERDYEEKSVNKIFYDKNGREA